jgi:hypothetical protein
MASRKQNQKSVRPPATTPEGRESQLVAAAMNLAEEQIREGTATAQVITHFLKLGTEREKLEREKLRGDNQLTQARIESLAAAGRIEKLYDEAMVAMRSYQGQRVPDEPLD